MKRHDDYAELGLRALRRAAAKVYENARKNNHKIPIWENGKVVLLWQDFYRHLARAAR